MNRQTAGNEEVYLREGKETEGECSIPNVLILRQAFVHTFCTVAGQQTFRFLKSKLVGVGAWFQEKLGRRPVLRF